MRVCVVIPAYRASGRIGAVLEGLAAWVPSRDTIVIDDGSGDGTADEAQARGVRVLVHEANRGKGAAHRSGFAAALASGYEAVLTLDADGQHDPNDLPKFLDAWREGRGDILLGSRWETLAMMPPLRRMVNRITSVVVSLLIGRRVEDSQSGYRLIAAEVLRRVPLRTARYQAESELLIKAGRAGFAIASVPIATRYAGETSYIDPLRDTLRFVGTALAGLWR
jgi:glycosyltransferase involved in cell wall biosynthesis